MPQEPRKALGDVGESLLLMAYILHNLWYPNPIAFMVVQYMLRYAGLYP